MAYLERSAMVRMSAVTNSSTTVSEATSLPVTPLSYSHNTNMAQESDRLCFTQLMTTQSTTGNDGFFSHVVRSDEYSTFTASALPAAYKVGFERPLPQGVAVDASELSCGLISKDSASLVGIQTMDSNYYNDNIVANSILVEVG